MKTKVLALVMTAMLAVSLAACGAGNGSSAAENSEATEAEGLDWEKVESEETEAAESAEVAEAEAGAEEAGEAEAAEATATEDVGEAEASDPVAEESSEANASAGETGEAAAEDADPTGLREDWGLRFTGGAEGTGTSGEIVYYIYDDLGEMAGIMVLTQDGSEIIYYIVGNVADDPYGITITDKWDDTAIALTWGEEPESGDFRIGLPNGSTADMTYVSKEEIIDDMVSVVERIYGMPVTGKR